MLKRILLVALVLLLATACSAEQREALQTAAAVPQATAPPANTPTETLAFSALPTALPTMGGPMGTMTAIADQIASPVPDSEPYEIAFRGVPIFIEFHAWW